jgi:hypothetical protein
MVSLRRLWPPVNAAQTCQLWRLYFAAGVAAVKWYQGQIYWPILAAAKSFVFFNFSAVFYTSQPILVATKLFFFCSEKRKINSILGAGSSEKYNACHCHFRISMKHALFNIWIQLQDSFSDLNDISWFLLMALLIALAFVDLLRSFSEALQNLLVVRIYFNL